MKKEIYNFLLKCGFSKDESFAVFNTNQVFNTKEKDIEIQISFIENPDQLEIYDIKNNEYLFKGIYKSKQDFFKIFDLVISSIEGIEIVIPSIDDLEKLTSMKLHEVLEIEPNNHHHFSILKVLGGWIYENSSENNDTQFRMCFVTNPSFKTQ